MMSISKETATIARAAYVAGYTHALEELLNRLVLTPEDMSYANRIKDELLKDVHNKARGNV